MSSLSPTAPDNSAVLVPLLIGLAKTKNRSCPCPELNQQLMPILQQTIMYLGLPASSHCYIWLEKANLCNKAEGPKLASRMAEIQDLLRDFLQFPEADPSSMEKLLVPRYVSKQYQRLDSETLRVRCKLQQFFFAVIYDWYIPEAPQGTPQWLVSELLCLDSCASDDADWYESIEEAEKQYAIICAKRTNGKKRANPDQDKAVEENDNDDDDDDDEADAKYWAQYDQTPYARSPAPPSQSTSHLPRVSSVNEQDYFDRYSEVQPAMDPNDPSVETGLELNNMAERNHSSLGATHPNLPPNSSSPAATSSKIHPVSQPKAKFSSILSRSLVEQLEAQSEQSPAEIAIKQHISSQVKSLYELAQKAGISRDEFSRIINTDFACLPMMDL